MFPFLLVILLSLPWKISASAQPAEEFLHCLSLRFENSSSITKLIYTQHNSSYSSVLKSAAQNFRFTTPSTPTPLAIITPLHPSHVQAAIYCSKKHGLQVRIRSAGHDFEGLSYTTDYKVPFVVIDLVNLRSVEVNVKEATALVESGATVGELYYAIARKSRTLGFPAGIGHTVGLGGQLSGGGFGLMFRKYGLAADNVIDARLIDVNGRILDRKSMGEDLFWAIRGGGGGSFGIVLAWKLKLVPVPANVTVFTVSKTLKQKATKLVHQWQLIAHKLPKELHMGVSIIRVNSTIQAGFGAVFLGSIDELVPLMEHNFPELGVVKEDCLEMSWAEANLASTQSPIGSPLETLLDRSIKSPLSKSFFKAKSDFVKQPIPESAFEGLWSKFYEEEAKSAVMVLVAYGGKMDEIPETETPYPHRAGNLYSILYVLNWEEEENMNSERFMNWMRGVYDYMTPYVSKSPREAYINYRDLEIGANDERGSYAQARIWGLKYFSNNFDRLVHVKTMVDPENFFRACKRKMGPWSAICLGITHMQLGLEWLLMGNALVNNHIIHQDNISLLFPMDQKPCLVTHGIQHMLEMFHMESYTQPNKPLSKGPHLGSDLSGGSYRGYYPTGKSPSFNNQKQGLSQYSSPINYRSNGISLNQNDRYKKSYRDVDFEGSAELTRGPRASNRAAPLDSFVKKEDLGLNLHKDC